MARDERRVAELAQRPGQAVRHADRAHQPELGLHEEHGKEVLGRGRHRLGPAEHAAPVRQGGEAILPEGEPLHLGIGGMLLDALLVRAGAGAVVQHGRVAVRDARQLVEPPARERAEAVEMGVEMRQEIGWQIERREPAQVGVRPPEVEAAAVRHGLCADGGCCGAVRIHG